MDCYYFTSLAPSLCLRRAIRESTSNLIGGTSVPHSSNSFRSLEKHHETELKTFKAMFRAGVAVAIPAAVHYCAEHGLVAPAWLTNASADLFCKILRLDTPKAMG